MTRRRAQISPGLSALPQALDCEYRDDGKAGGGADQRVAADGRAESGAQYRDARPWGDNRDADKGPDSRRC